jgi:hypothetical protein
LLQDRKRSNADNLRNEGREASRYFRSENREDLKVKSTNLKENKNKNVRDFYRDTNEFKKGYDSRNYIAKIRRVICLQPVTAF